MKEVRHLERKWKLLCGGARGIVRAVFRFDSHGECPEGTCLVVSNHVTNFDPILLGVSFPKKPMCFVASEHLFRKGWMTRAIRWLFDPIAKRKGSAGMETAMACMRRIRAGRSVCVFAEGETTWDGRTQPIPEATGSLARMCGASLVTFRLEGGYLTAPRWAAKMRRGRMTGRVVNVYSPETLKAMSPAEITRAINSDIYEDAWARQKQHPVAYKGQRPAEDIGVALFLCPKCHRLGTVHGRGDRVRCACGLDVAFTPYGTFDPPVPFENIAQWDAWQHEALAGGQLETQGSVLSDDGLVLTRIVAGHGEQEVDRGSLRFSREGLVFGERMFPFGEIRDMALLQRRKLVFTHDDNYYEIRSEKPLCMRKYLAVWQLAQGTKGV